MSIGWSIWERPAGPSSPYANDRGNLIPAATFPRRDSSTAGASSMDGIIYLIGLIVVIMAILSFFGLR